MPRLAKRFLSLTIILSGFLSGCLQTESPLTVTSQQTHRVTSLYLVNTDSGEDIRALLQTDTIDLGTLEHSLSIRADVTEDVGVTISSIDGQEVNRSARGSLSLNGVDASGNYVPYGFSEGTTDLTFQPSKKINGVWTRGSVYRVKLRIKDTSTLTYADDTFESDLEVTSSQRLSSLFDYESYLLSGAINREAYTRFKLDTERSSGRHVLDAIGSHFLVDANDEPNEPDAQNSNSGADANGLDKCENGFEPVNIYPLDIRNPSVSVLGGIFHGYFPGKSPHVGIPQDSDWEFSYCNSAAILFKNADEGHVDGARITSAWDAVRPSANFVVENSWFSRVRDDVLENDDNTSGVFQDNLVDGAFQAISSKDGDVNGSSRTVQVLGNVIKLRSYAYKVIDGEVKQYFGALFKYDDKAPSTVVKDTVIAVEPNALGTGGSINTFYDQWDQGWDSISTCGNNIFLWLSEDDSYRAVQDRVIRDMPGCFKVETGAKAIDIWNQARQNWVDCHPKVGRAKEDLSSDFSRCRAKAWGGYSYSD